MFIDFLKKYFIPGAFIGILLLGFGLWATGNFGVSLGSQDKAMLSIDAYAEKMVVACKDAPYRPTCYEKEVPKLVESLTLDEIFDVIRAIRQKDKEYLFCHVLAHELGVYEVSLDPDNWLDVVAKAPPDGLCSNGFSHGAVLARFNDEVLSEEELQFALGELAIACESRENWNPTNLMKAICYHGIGHVLIHMTDAKVEPSLDACEVVAIKDDGRDYRQVCAEGVYMQLFQPLEPEDYALIDQLPVAPTSENIETFCEDQSSNDRQYGACWREAWPLFYEALFDPDGVMEYCSVLSESQGREQCFVTAFTINGRHHLGEPEKMAGLCNALPAQYQGMCLARGANAFPEEGQELIEEAIDMCSRGSTDAAQDECYGFLAQTASFNFHPGSETHQKMCSMLPDKWKSKCN